MRYSKSRYLKIGVVLFLCLSSYYAFYSIPYASCTVTWSYNSTTNTATASGSGTTNFTALVAGDTAGGWGKFTADATGTQITCAALIKITDTVTFEDNRKQVTFTNFPSAGDSFIDVAPTAFCTMGVLNDLSTKSTSNGCDFIFLVPVNYQYCFTSLWNNAFNINLYSCTFKSVSYASSVLIWANRLWNCYFDGAVSSDRIAINGSIYNLNMLGAGGGSGLAPPYNSGTTADRILILNQYNGVTIFGALASTFTISNILMRHNTNSFSPYGANSAPSTVNLINVDCDEWNFDWGTSTYPITVNRLYEYDLFVLNGEITDFVENANVTLTKGSYRGTWLTNSSGQIDTTTQTYGYYDQAHGDTIQDATEPFTLTVTHPDWATYTSRFYITEKTKMTISMQEVQTQATPDPEQYTENDDVSTYFVIGLMSLIVLIIILILWSKQK